MIFYIKDKDDKLYATCKFNKDSKSIVLEKSSLVKKNFDCSGCDAIKLLRNKLLVTGKLKEHNDEVYLLKQRIEFTDINSAVCLVLGGKLLDAECLIQNEFGKSIQEVYSEVLQ